MGNTSKLTPFQKGKSGNPKGRKSGTQNFATIAAKFLDLTTDLGISDGEPQKMTYRQAMVFRAIHDACHEKDPKARLAALNTVLDRLEGKPVARIEAEVEEKKSLYVLPGGIEIEI